MSSTIRRAGGVCIFVSIVVGAACAPGDGAVPNASETASGFQGVLVDPPQEKPDFTLLDTNGELFDFRERTEGRVALLFFGYTSCPDICPVHMANIATVLRRFPHDVRSRVDVVFVTTDPERDTPERIREWLDNFDSSFIGLRGDTAEVARIQHGLNMPAAVQQELPGGGYGVGHSSWVVAFTADGLARVIYPSGIRQEQWENDIPRLVAHGAGDS